MSETGKSHAGSTHQRSSTLAFKPQFKKETDKKGVVPAQQGWQPKKGGYTREKRRQLKRQNKEKTISFKIQLMRAVAAAQFISYPVKSELH